MFRGRHLLSGSLDFKKLSLKKKRYYNDCNMKKTTIIVIIITISLVIVSYIFGVREVNDVDPSISSFDQCIEAGYPSIDSYPEQCETPDGKRFVRNLPEDELENVISPITVKGEIVCLSHWDLSGPITLECALGLKSEEGDYYSLRTLDPSDMSIAMLPTGTHIEITGIFIPGSDKRYRTIGSIEVEKVEELLTFTDDRLSFLYPALFPAEYVTVHQWPPEVEVIDNFICPEISHDMGFSWRLRIETIDNREYCILEITEEIPGSIHTDYEYVIDDIKGYSVRMRLSLTYPDCENYAEPRRTFCINEREIFNPDNIVNRIIESMIIYNE